MSKMTKVLEEVREVVQGARWTAGAAKVDGAKMPQTLIVVHVAAGSFLRMAVFYTWCRFRGHSWDVEGHAGPDSGWEEYTCRRCRYSTTVSFY